MKLNVKRFALACILSLCGFQPAYSAEEGLLSDLRGGISSLFGSKEETTSGSVVAKQGQINDAPSLTGRRVPFSNEEVILSFAPLVAQTSSSVVNVYAERMPQQRQSPFAGDPLFEQLFGGGFFDAPQRAQSSLGSGVIADSSGLIVTNYHVIEGADQIRVAMADGREYESTTILADKALDLAVIRIETGQDLTALTLGDSDEIAVGDLVLAIGNPFGVGQTTTSGIISATARSGVGVSDFGFFLQTDAAINPGNSGGALIDMRGHLIGINTAIFSRSGGSNGIGFAIPSNMVRAVVAQAARGNSTFERPWIGADFDAVTPDIAESLGLDRPYGAIITRIITDSPAEKAGLKAGDVVLKADGADIQHPDALGYRLAVHGIGEKSTLHILRPSGAIDAVITLASRPEPEQAAKLLIEGKSPFAGAVVENIETRDGLRVIISGLSRGAPAANAGFRPGDIILKINGDEVTDAAQMQILASSNARWWRFSILRNGRVINQMLRF